MATYRFPRMLTLLAWERELQHGPYTAERAWSEPDPTEHLDLDFSRVEFADFGALASALLLLDAAVKSGIPATVTLPTRAVLPAGEREIAGPMLAERRARARGDALFFMRQVGFLDSLRAPHWDTGVVRILDRATADGQEPRTAPGNQEPDPQDTPYQRRRVFPFRWLEPMPAAQLRESESFAAVSAGLEDLGLSRSDARTLSQTVLTELVENVAEHGSDGDRPPVALVGAIMLTAETYALRANGMHGHMAEVVERALADGSHVLRLIVADSGVDLAGRLVPTYRHGLDNRSIAEHRREAILAALGKRSDATMAATDKGRGTTGLLWVTRVVRSYHGGVQARTADLLAGLLFGREPGGTGLAEDGFGYVPGTLLELTLPIGPFPLRPRRPWESLPVNGTAPRLDWVNCSFDPQRGLTDADRTRLADRMRTVHPDRDADGLIVTVPLHDADHGEIDDRSRGAIHQLLEYASSIARWGPVAVVFPDAEPHILDPCVAAFNEGLAASGEDTQQPILVVSRLGEPAWCGGSVPLRAVLTLLSEEQGAVDVGEAEKRWQQAGGEPGLFPGTLHANGYLLSIGPNRLELRLSLPAVLGPLVAAVSGQVTEAVSRGGAGVELGVFRGPTLSLVDRWISVEELVTGTVGVSLATFILARKVELTLRASQGGEAPTTVVQVRSVPRPLTRQLSECLALGGRYHTQQSELNVDEPPTGEQVAAGAKVVLCSDVVVTENTVRRAVAMIAGHDANPLVIACVVDTRHVPVPIRLLNRTIPIVSLTEVKVGLGESAGENVRDIDPLTLRPELPLRGDSAPGDEVDLLTWFADAPDVVRLGHIDDPPSRHYSAFIRLQAMRQEQRRDQITDAVLSNVRGAFADIRAEGGPAPGTEIPLAIWYVSADGNAERLADTVRNRLNVEGFPVNAVTPIPRMTIGDAWAFPASLSAVTRPLGVLIIHWWAYTGNTLLQLVRLAAKSGASWIAAVCVLNQLEDANHAEVLRMLRAMSVPRAVAAGESERHAGDVPRASSIPVSIRFVAHSSIIAFDAYRCPVCATRERYQLGDDTAPPRLINHAALLRDMLRPRELDEVARDSAADLFTVPVTGHEATDYLRWRGLLLRALQTVRHRQEVIDRLRTLIGDEPPEFEWTSVGLIRLLAAEQQWLRLPPLYFQSAADLLSQVCVQSFEQLTAPLWVRVQALMVMSAAVPQQLVEQLPRLLASAGNEAILIDQMLLDCCRLLLRAPANSPIDVVQLRHNLLECRNDLEEQRIASDATAAEDHLHAVRNLLTIAHYRVLSKPQTPQAAWERLREDLVHPVIRHRLEADLLLVRSFVEDIERVEPTPESARAAEADWETCARQLEERALSNLPPLREILAGDFVSDWLGRRDQRRLLTLARADVGELRAVTDRLHTLARGPWRPTDPSWQALRRELLNRINWWNRIFLAAHLTDNELSALLVELIKSAPSKPGPCVARLLDSHRAKATIGGAEYDEVELFCPERLLDQIVAHLLENIQKHRAPGTPCRLHVEYKQPDHDTLHIVIRNSGTVARIPPGRGIKTLNDKLRPFGGSLSGQVLNEDKWTFAALIALPLWHGE
jgi:adenine/guanine phosphoribosyltransferase-like PRPP-binding protein